MSSASLYALIALVTAPWWWRILTALRADLRAVAESGTGTTREPQRASAARVLADTRVPLNRRLAFHGRARRVTSRARWEGGFGRRSL